MSQTNLLNTLPKITKPVTWLISSQENTSGLSHTRFIQDTATNWMPKAAFSRSKADFAEMSFLEFGESALFYYAPVLLGEKVFRKLYTGKLPEKLKKEVAKPAKLIKNNKNIFTKKAAIALACFSIPIAEYALSFAKNLFTLKVFKTADFEAIANLNHKKKDEKQAKKLEKNAKKHLALSGLVSAGCIVGSIAFATKGKDSKFLQQASEYILTPGAKLTKKAKSQKLKNIASKYLSFDFADNNGKLALSHGQLTASVTTGLAGYLLAAKDRGKLNFLEDLSRVPLVAFYTVVGSSLLEHGFKKILKKKEVFPELINEKLEVPKLGSLNDLAEKLAKKNGTDKIKEFKKLFRGKAVITGVPFLFSLLVMGAATSGLSRFWTKYRYNQQAKSQQSNENLLPTYHKPIQNNIFRDFLDKKEKWSNNKTILTG